MVDRRGFLGTAGAAIAALAGVASRRGRARKRSERRVVGARNRQAAKRAADRATEVHRVLDLDERGWLVVGEFPATRASALGADSGVKYVVRDPKARALDQDVPWGVSRVGGEALTRTGYTGARVDVAVIDSGIDSNHPDLRANLGTGTAFTEADGNYAEAWDDDYGHGTHCAGTIAAIDNSRGVLGVAPDVRLHAAKVLDDSGSGYMSDIAAAIEWAADQGYDVASMSLGGPRTPFLGEACGYAYDRGVLLVAAAGNGGCTDCVEAPANYEEVLAVGATDRNDDLAGFSSKGPEVEIAAPGVGVRSTVPGGYGWKQGTSMACPHVAAAGAHLMALGYPHAETPSDVSNPGGTRGRLRETAEDIGLSANQAGSGLLDIDGALDGASRAIGETGTLELKQPEANDWRAVSFSGEYTNPVVLTGPVSENGSQPVHTRLRNVSPSGFDLRLEEWEYLDGAHTTEEVSYVVLEGGQYTLGDGTRVEAGIREFDTDGARVSFEGAFDDRPAVFSTVQTHRGGQAVITRQQNVSSSGFECTLQEEERLGSHATEAVGYLAADTGTGRTGNARYAVGRTPDAVEDAWYGIDFGDEFDRTPTLLAAMQTASGTNTAALRYQSLDSEGVSIAIEEETSDNSETSHTTESAGYLAVGGSGPIYGRPPGTAVGEAGRVRIEQSSKNGWHRVPIDGTYDRPVVLTGPVSENGSQPVHTRLRNVSSSGFDLRLEEWEYLDGTHIEETVEYLVVEAGGHTLEDGTQVEAGTEEFDDSGRQIGFGGAFAGRPVVFSTVQTKRGGQSVVTRQRGVSSAGFECTLQEEERLGSHATEVVGYLAVDTNTGAAGNVAAEANRTADTVDDGWFGIDFAASYDTAPVVLAAMQTTDGNDTAAVRTRSHDTNGIDVRIEEETSDDDETSHTTESVGYFAVGGPQLVAR